MNVFNHFLAKELIDIIFKYAHNGRDTYIQDINIMIFCQEKCHLSEFNKIDFPFYLFALLCIQAKKHKNIYNFINSTKKYFIPTSLNYGNHECCSTNTVYFYLQDFLSYK